MVNMAQLDAFFNKLLQHMPELLPDGIVDINVKTLHEMNLLSDSSISNTQGSTGHLLQAIDSGGKITLYNEQFALWIAPQKNSTPSSTLVFIATRSKNELKPEVGFRTKGIYNHSKTILRLIDRFLIDIQETESIISKLERSNPSP